LLASEYHWSRQEIWWEVPFAEVMMWVAAIVERKRKEFGGDKSAPIMDDDMVRLYDTIELVKQEQRDGTVRH